MPGAIVIGAGPGIGTSVAQRLAREGLAVAVLALLGGHRRRRAGGPRRPRWRDRRRHGGRHRRAGPARCARRGGGSPRRPRGPGLQRGADPVGRARRAHRAAAPRRLGRQRRGRHQRRCAPRPRDGAGGRGTILLTGGMPKSRCRRDQPVAGQGRHPRADGAGGARLRALRHPSRDRHRRGCRGAGLAFDPDEIAEQYWRLHTQPRGAWEREVLYSGPVTAAAARPPQSAG